MNDQQSIRNELVEALIGVRSVDITSLEILGDNDEDRLDAGALADSVLASPVIRRIQAEALREAIRGIWANGALNETDEVRRYLHIRADRIEKGD